jgi:hypothetical protein
LEKLAERARSHLARQAQEFEEPAPCHDRGAARQLFPRLQESE